MIKRVECGQMWTHMKQNYSKLQYNNINYLQLLYRKVKGILLYQWFPRPILPAAHPATDDDLLAKLVGETRG